MKRTLQVLYTFIFARLGRPAFVGANRYARYLFLTMLGVFQRMIGIPVELRWRRLRSGVWMLCDLRDNIQAELYFLGDYSEPELRYLRRSLLPGDWFVDIGANCGLFAIEAAHRIGPGGRVIAFEPAPDMADRLRLNAIANGVAEAIEIHEVALGSEPDHLTLYAPQDNPDDTGRRSLFCDGAAIAEVPVHRLDDLVEKGTVGLGGPVRVVKIDVEGGEGAVLAGMRGVLERNRPGAVIVETVDEHQDRADFSIHALDELMRESGYLSRPERLEHVGPMLNNLYVPSEPG